MRTESLIITATTLRSVTAREARLYSIQTAKSFTELLLFDGGKKAVGLTGTSLDILEIR